MSGIDRHRFGTIWLGNRGLLVFSRCYGKVMGRGVFEVIFVRGFLVSGGGCGKTRRGKE